MNDFDIQLAEAEIQSANLQQLYKLRNTYKSNNPAHNYLYLLTIRQQITSTNSKIGNNVLRETEHTIAVALRRLSDDTTLTNKLLYIISSILLGSPVLSIGDYYSVAYVDQSIEKLSTVVKHYHTLWNSPLREFIEKGRLYIPEYNTTLNFKEGYLKAPKNVTLTIMHNAYYSIYPQDDNPLVQLPKIPAKENDFQEVIDTLQEVMDVFTTKGVSNDNSTD